MTDYATFQLAALNSPLPAATTNTLLQDADPCLYWFIQWVTGVIQVHCGARWDAEVTAMGHPEMASSTAGAGIVTQTIPYDPVPVFQEAQFTLPLLAIYRVDSDFTEQSRAWIKRVGTWYLDYILPPFSPAQLERIAPILAAIEAAIFDRIEFDYDPNVLGGQLLKNLMLTQSIRVMPSKPSRDWLKTNVQQAPGTLNTVLFPLLHMKFEVTERKMPDTFPAWTGTDIKVLVSNGTTSVDISDAALHNP